MKYTLAQTGFEIFISKSAFLSLFQHTDWISGDYYSLGKDIDDGGCY